MTAPLRCHVRMCREVRDVVACVQPDDTWTSKRRYALNDALPCTELDLDSLRSSIPRDTATFSAIGVYADTAAKGGRRSERPDVCTKRAIGLTPRSY